MTASIDLYCIPFAGGNAYSYRSLEKQMHPSVTLIPLELLGRGRRSGESRATCMHEIASDLLSCISSSLDRPFAIFGHSMGGLTAYLVTCLMVKENLPLPRHLFISGKRPPHLVRNESPWHDLPLDKFKQKLAGLGGCPPEVLNDHELMDYFAPIIRDDMEALANYKYEITPPFEVPITALIGSKETTTFAEVSEWERMTTSDFRAFQYEGGHFFIYDHLEDICEMIHSTLFPN